MKAANPDIPDQPTPPGRRPAKLVTAADFLPDPPARLDFEQVTLRFEKTIPGNSQLGLVPAYHFRILVEDMDVGHINLRVGDNDHVRICVGHIGYEITPAFRGHRYALQACRALAPFAHLLVPEVIITCNPDNFASQRTIELLGAKFLDQVAVPPEDPHYAHGARWKLRYRWSP